MKLNAAPIPGFNNQSLVHVANKQWVTLLDGGATCSSIPEEMLEEVFNLTAMAVEKKGYTWGSPEGPINCFEDFEVNPRNIEGLAKDKPIVSRAPWSSESSLYLSKLRPGPCVPFG